MSVTKYNLEGYRFGRLFVKSFTYEYRSYPSKYRAIKLWICKCDCGNEKKITTSALVKGLTVSCGCFNRERASSLGPRTDLTGKRFDRLYVEEYGCKDPNNKSIRGWKCKCDCGNITYVRTSALQKGRVTSCGCKHIDGSTRHPLAWTGFNDLSGTYWNRLKKGALLRGFIFDITIEEAWDRFIIQEGRCCLSGIPIYFGRVSRVNPYNQTASLDRIDNNQGYIKGNIQWLHKDINSLKSTFSQEELVNLCRQITFYQDNRICLI